MSNKTFDKLASFQKVISLLRKVWYSKVMDISYTITSHEHGKTVKQFFAELNYSTEHVKRLKYEPCGITVNGEHKTVRCVLKEGDVLRLHLPVKVYTAQGTREKARILYADEYLYVAEKPYGVFTHADNVHFGGTFADMLANSFQNFELHVLTRLDYTTSGVVLGALDPLTAERLATMLEKREVQKVYYAICTSRPKEPSGTVCLPLSVKNSTAYVDYENGKEAITEYEVVRQTPKGFLLKLTPVTGRTHQLRAHLSAIGCAILGDEKYGGQPSDRVYLHASQLTFTHPVTHQTVTVKSDCNFD